jgi:hypothetical protein
MLVERYGTCWLNDLGTRAVGRMAMITQDYRTNRARFPRDELAKYQGAWVAFSADGCRIVAHGETMERLEEQILAVGEDPQRVVREWVAGPEDDNLLAGGQLL